MERLFGMWIALTGHLSTPREPILKENPKSATDTTQRSMASKNKHGLDNVAQHLIRYIRPKPNTERVIRTAIRPN